jgi:hypothetical protein
MSVHECSNGHELRWFQTPECPDCGREADDLGEEMVEVESNETGSWFEEE